MIRFSFSPGAILGAGLAALFIACATGDVQAQSQYSCDRYTGDGRYCAAFYDELHPTVRTHSQGMIGPVIGGIPTNVDATVDTDADRQSFGRAVGRLTLHFRSVADPTDEFVIWCTASILNDQYILTAQHCVETTEPQYYLLRGYLVMNYMVDTGDYTFFDLVRGSNPECRTGAPETAICPVTGNIRRPQGGERLDFAVMEIGRSRDGLSASHFGAIHIVRQQLRQGEAIWVFHHPQTLTQIVSGHRIVRGHDRDQFVHAAWTWPVSSGAPILSIQGSLLGVHNAGGGGACETPQPAQDSALAMLNPVQPRTQQRGNGPDNCTNYATSLRALLVHSPIIRNLATDPAPTAGGFLSTLGSSRTMLAPRSTADFALLQQRAERGESAAQWELGMKYLWAGDPSGYLAWRRVTQYANEPALEQDFAAAVRWLEAAARQDPSRARPDLMFATMVQALSAADVAGGGPDDVSAVLSQLEGAVRALREEADNGDMHAQLSLALVAIDLAPRLGLQFSAPELNLQPSDGVELLRRSADGGNIFSAGLLADLLAEGTPFLPRDQAAAAAYYTAPARAGIAEAQFSLGELYLNGEGVRQDRATAVNYFRAAAAQGHPQATDRLTQLGERAR